MTAQEMWDLFSTAQNITAEFDAWAFGDDADGLADLVSRGIKRATTSLHLWYELENEPLPQAGEYSVILNGREEAVCVIQTTGVTVTPYQEVDASFACLEGEGDRSLAYWRRVHEAFFTGELKEAGMSFDPSMKVVCEEFIKVYP